MRDRRTVQCGCESLLSVFCDLPGCRDCKTRYIQGTQTIRRLISKSFEVCKQYHGRRLFFSFLPTSFSQSCIPGANSENWKCNNIKGDQKRSQFLYGTQGYWLKPPLSSGQIAQQAAAWSLIHNLVLKNQVSPSWNRPHVTGARVDLPLKVWKTKKSQWLTCFDVFIKKTAKLFKWQTQLPFPSEYQLLHISINSWCRLSLL